jgi:hypothetical protein
MANNKEYTVTDLYQHLKLDIWRSGRVAGWGDVRKVNVRSDNTVSTGYHIAKPLSSYSPFSPAKQLGTGLYLLDLQSVKRDVWNRQLVYIAIIAVCKSTMSHIQTIHCLQITNSLESGALRKLMTDNPAQASIRKRKPLFRTGKTPRAFDSSPLHSVRRKH